MSISNRIGKLVVAVAICVTTLYILGLYTVIRGSVNNNDKTSRYPVNNVRTMVSSIMLFLEKNNTLVESDPTARKSLEDFCGSINTGLIYSGLDGKIMFRWGVESVSEVIDPKNDVHYDLYQEKTEYVQYRVAFPVVDKNSGVQVGNAIFILPADKVLTDGKQSGYYTVIIFMTLIYFFSLLFIFLLWRSITTKMILPVRLLKRQADAALAGNFDEKAVSSDEKAEYCSYNEKTEYSSPDEIGSLFASFEQMKQELKFLQTQNTRQLLSQKELISNISHDIRTPLSSVKAYIDSIRDGVCKDMPTVMEYIEVMHHNTDKIVQLVEDLFYHSLKELGQISVTPRQVYSQAVLSEIIAPLKHSAQTKGVEFVIEEPIPNVLINADTKRLEQVISNLVSNSLKHTAAGDIITFRAAVLEDSLKISVIDTGEGVMPEDMSFLFERYFKGSRQSYETNAAEGAGLGLSICKYIIEAHGGSIYFKNNPDRGTEFYFFLPLV